MSSFSDFCRSLGLIPPIIIEPGRWIRCATEDHPKSRNGALKLFCDGLAGVARNHGTMHKCATWHRADEHLPKLSPETLRAHMTKASAERARSEAVATAAAWLAWMEARPIRNRHPYLEKKRLGIEGVGMLRVDSIGRLMVPMYGRNGKFSSLQSIDGDGGKKFWLGAPASGCRYTLARQGATVSILCEGLSTGLTLYCAVPNASVIVAFNAANMEVVAKSRQWRGLVVVAGDNDSDTEERIGRNPGVVAATKAAEAIGCGTAIPAGNGDWNDVYCARLAAMGESNRMLSYLPSELASRKWALMGVRASVMANARYIAP